MSTSAPYGGPCSRCLSFPCRCTSGPVFYNPPPATPMSDVDLAWWRVQISGSLLDLTKQVRELTEIVHKIAERLAEQNTGTERKDA